MIMVMLMMILRHLQYRYTSIEKIRAMAETGVWTMNITYKKLTEKELDTFIQMRINQLREEGATEDIDLGGV